MPPGVSPWRARRFTPTALAKAPAASSPSAYSLPVTWTGNSEAIATRKKFTAGITDGTVAEGESPVAGEAVQTLRHRATRKNIPPS